VYSITPFVLYRPYEFIRNYIDHEKIPVKLLGGGREKDYGYLGFSHWAEDDSKVMSNFSNIKSLWPSDEESLEKDIDDYLFDGKPNYMNLSR
jgi:transketolase